MVQVPTLKKTQRIGARGASQVADPNLARAKGDIISAAGRVVQGIAVTQKQFNEKAKNAEIRMAVTKAQTQFDVFMADFNKELAENKVAGKDYRELYEQRYSEFANTFMEQNEEYQDQTRTALDSSFADTLGKVQANGNKKRAADIVNQGNSLNQQNMLMLRSNPNKFQDVMERITTSTMDRVETGDLTQAYADEELGRLAQEASLSAIDGYMMQRNYNAAREFTRNPEVANLLGRETQKKVFDQIDNKQAQYYNAQANREDREYTIEKRQIEEAQNTNFFEVVKSLNHIKSPKQFEVIEKQIVDLGIAKGLSRTQATGLLTQLDSGWKEVDASNEYAVAIQVSDAPDATALSAVEDNIAKMVASKKIMPQTATKWQNVIRGIKNREAQDPRFKKEYTSYKGKLEGRLPGKGFLDGLDPFNPTKTMAADIMFDYNMATLKHSPSEAYKMALQKYKLVELKAGVVSNLTGDKLDSSEALSRHMGMLANMKSSGKYSDEDIKRGEQQAVSAKKINETTAELEGMDYVENIFDLNMIPDYNENIAIPFRRGK